MTEESFVSFGTANLLKDAGFDVPCVSIYIQDDKGKHWQNIAGRYAVSEDMEYNARNYYLAPTQALAARWLREVHGIHVFSFFQYHTQRWVYYIAKLSAPNAEIGMIFSEKDYDGHEQAMEDGLQEAVELIKK